MGLLPENPRDQRNVAIIVVAVALAALFYQFVYTPKATELELVQERVEGLEAANDKAKKELAKGNVNELRAQAEQSKQSLELMRQLVPTGNEVPALLEQVSNAARRAGLEIAAVEPQPVISGEQFDTYRYRFQVSGSYHAIGEFLTNVGSLPRIMSPVNLRLSPVTSNDAKKAAAKGQSLIGSQFEIQTYVAKSSVPGDGRAPTSESKS